MGKGRKAEKSASPPSKPPAPVSERLKGFLKWVFQVDHLVFLSPGLIAGGSGMILDTWLKIPYGIMLLCFGLFVGAAALLIKQNVTRQWLIPSLVLLAVILSFGGIRIYRFISTSPATKTISLYELNRHPLGDIGDWKGTKFEPINISQTKQLESAIPKSYYNRGFYRLRPCMHQMSHGTKLLNVSLTLRIASDLKIEVQNQRPDWHHISKDGYEEYSTVLPEVGYRVIQPTPEWFTFNRSGHQSFQIIYRVEGKDELGRKVSPPDTTITLLGLESR